MNKNKKSDEHTLLKERYVGQAEQQLQSFLRSDRKLVFPSIFNPEVSIIIVTYKQTALELLCLMSILRWAADISYEVIISNNGTSTDNKKLLDKLENVKIINHEKNLGFVKGVNAGAQEASGNYLLFLNDDALLTYGCVQALVKQMRGWPVSLVGAVGAQIRRLDNTIQDAGGILWNNGQAAEYSKGRNPELGDVNFVREVNYVSGACFMTPKSLFLRLGMFDEVYSPGYCEESDYCLRLREEGYKVIYEPKARVVHYEYGSSNPNDVSNLVKEHTEILFKKHTDALIKGYHPSTPTVYARDTKKYRGRVLIVEDFIPHLHYGDTTLSDYIGDLVKNNFFVTFFPKYSGVDDWMSVYEHLPETVEVMLYEDITGLGHLLAERPRFYDYFISSVYDFTELIAKSNSFDGKYVIQLKKDEDYGSERLQEILKPTALWVDWHIPEYDSNAGDYAVYSYCSMLKELGFKIRYWSNDPNWKNQDARYIGRLYKDQWEIWNSDFSFESTIADLGHTIDLVVLARPDAINYIKAVRDWTTAPIIYYCHDLHYLRQQRQYMTECENKKMKIDPVKAMRVEKQKEIEYDIIDRTDLLVTVSQYEKEEINRELPDAKVSVWPWYCPPKHTPPRHRHNNKQIEFLGGLQHTPNLDAINWFLDDIYPLIKEGFDRPRFNIIGSHIPQDIQDLHDGDLIYVRGFIKDLSAQFIMGTVFVAPIRYGAGLKGKIAMAMSHGLPVVTTTIGAEGIGLTHEENVLIADTAEDFAKEVLRLMHDEELWSKIANNSLEFARTHWSPEVVKKHLLADLRGLGYDQSSVVFLKEEGVAIA
jgi:GT2 family glycosyltransferase